MGMAGDSLRHAFLETIKTELRPGESPLAVFPASTTAEPAEGLAPAELWPVIIAADRLLRWRRNRAVSRASLFPLSSRMLMGLTDQRLLIWAAGPRWRPGRFLGYVARDRILQVTAPVPGAGWQAIVIHLATEPAVSIKVPPSAASRLIPELSGVPSQSEAPEPG
jgi:hypothetical protein